MTQSLVFHCKENFDSIKKEYFFYHKKKGAIRQCSLIDELYYLLLEGATTITQDENVELLLIMPPTSEEEEELFRKEHGIVFLKKVTVKFLTRQFDIDLTDKQKKEKGCHQDCGRCEKGSILFEGF